MSRATRGLMLAALIAIGQPARADEAPDAALACGPGAPLTLAVRLDYRVTASRGLLSLSGEGTVTYRRTGDSYAMTSTLRAASLFEARQTSDGRVGPDGLVPLAFTQQTSRRPLLRVDFDWASGKVAFSRGGARVPTRPQMQDRLSLLFHLAWRHRAQPGAAIIELPVAGQSSVTTYAISVGEPAEVTVPAGTFDTVKFEREHPGRGDVLEVWLAPALCSMPVRLRFTDERGTVIEQQLVAVRQLDP